MNILHNAVSQGNLNEVEAIVYSQLIDVNVRNDSGQTALHLAVKLGKNEIAKYLIDKGANVDVRDIYYEGSDISCFKTPLNYAVTSRNHQIVNYLLKHGANPNLEDAHGITPLEYALKDITLVKSLVEYGADIDRSDALTYFTKIGDFETIKYLVDHAENHTANLNIRNSSNDTLLYTAIELGHTEIAKYFIEKQSGINTQSSASYKFPLHLATSMNSFELVDHLIKNGANVNVQDGYGDTALHLAVRNKDIVELIVKNNADINIVDNGNNTPLMKAARYSYFDTVRYLLERDSKIDYEKLLEVTQYGINERKGLLKVIEHHLKYVTAEPQKLRYENILEEEKNKERIGEETLKYIEKAKVKNDELNIQRESEIKYFKNRTIEKMDTEDQENDEIVRNKKQQDKSEEDSKNSIITDDQLKNIQDFKKYEELAKNEKQITKDQYLQEPPEYNNSSIAGFLRNIVSDFFGLIYNWFIGNNQIDIETNIAHAFSANEQNSAFNTEEDQSDYDFI